MAREQMTNFLESLVVFLLLTNVLSAFAATYAIWGANGFLVRKRQWFAATKRRDDALLRRAV
jgi:hypothetical protein